MPAIKMTIVIDDLDHVLPLYDQVQVFRSTDSTDGTDGTFTEITADQPQPATLAGSVEGPWNLDGTDLVVVMNGADPLVVPFVSTIPLSLSEVIAAINATLPDLAAEDGIDTDRLVLTSPLMGTGSSLAVSGTAAATLGLSTSQVQGRGKRIRLTDPTVRYQFTDLGGEATHWYKWRFFSSVVGAVSSFSAAVLGDPQVVAAAVELSTATLKLIDAAGRPVVDRRVTFVPLAPLALLTSGYTALPGVDRLFVTTDVRGEAAIDLVRGMQCRVFFGGSSFHRTFTVPDQATFDLMALIADAPDPFDPASAPARPIKVS